MPYLSQRGYCWVTCDWAWILAARGLSCVTINVFVLKFMPKWSVFFVFATSDVHLTGTDSLIDQRLRHFLTPSMLLMNYTAPNQMDLSWLVLFCDNVKRCFFFSSVQFKRSIRNLETLTLRFVGCHRNV